jgi:hypothetical protein
MKVFPAILLFLIAIIVSSCSKRPEDQIVGNWDEAGGSGYWDFHQDGTVELRAEGKGLSGHYAFINDSKIKLQLGGTGSALGPQVYDFTLAGDTMTWQGIDGRKTEFTRAK